MYKNFFKRGIDIIASLVLLALLSPLLIIVVLLIKMTSPGPVFFKQTRVGKGCKPFTLLKFRSMTNEKHEVKKYTGRDEGVTPIGYYLRKYKIDELPQLIHVLKGEMSLVGPRPSIPAHLERMNEKELKRYNIRPGMTGLAQVSGNIHLDWKDRFTFDLEYLENISFLNDLRILKRTALLIIVGEEKFLNKPLKLQNADH